MTEIVSFDLAAVSLTANTTEPDTSVSLPSPDVPVSLPPDSSLVPQYLVDFESGDVVLVLNRHTGKEKTYTQKEFETFDWCPTGATVAGEAAHCFRYSPWSKSQRWESPEALRNFFGLAKAKQIDLRGMPEGTTWRHRETAGIEQKTGIDDLRAWDHALRTRPHLWISFQRPENLGEFLDSKKDHRNRTPEEHTRQTVGFALREDLKEESCELSAEGGNYKKSAAGKIAYEAGCIGAVRDRLQKHTSNPGGPIVNGVAVFTHSDGRTFKINLAETVMGFTNNRNGGTFKKKTQYVSCMMLLVDKNGNRRLNPMTNAPHGIRIIKQFGMVASAFHRKSGFLRPKFNHHGIKSIAKDIIGTKTIQNAEGEKSNVVDIDPQNPMDAKLRRWVTRVCTIAYEQTVRAMRDYLDERTITPSLD